MLDRCFIQAKGGDRWRLRSLSSGGCEFVLIEILGLDALRSKSEENLVGAFRKWNFDGAKHGHDRFGRLWAEWEMESGLWYCLSSARATVA